MTFENHMKRKFTPRPSRASTGATINGRPAWQVAEERRQAAIASAKGQAS